MQPFRYLIYLIKGIFTAKPALRPSMSEGIYLDTLATQTGLSRAQIEGFITAQSALHVELARQGIPVDFVMKRFRVVPSCGGRYTSPDPDSGEVCATLNFSLVVHPDEIDKMRVGCPLEKTGEAGELGPVVESVRSRPGKLLNKYGVGTTGGTEVNGEDFRERRPMRSGPRPSCPRRRRRGHPAGRAGLHAHAPRARRSPRRHHRSPFPQNHRRRRPLHHLGPRAHRRVRPQNPFHSLQTPHFEPKAPGGRHSSSRRHTRHLPHSAHPPCASRSALCASPIHNAHYRDAQRIPPPPTTCTTGMRALHLPHPQRALPGCAPAP
jgi:hypothetical protein